MLKKCWPSMVVIIIIGLFQNIPMTIAAKEIKEGTIKIFNVKKNSFEEVHKIIKDKDEWRQTLTAEQFHVTQEEGTERAFTGALLKNKAKGVYQCVACQTDLFSSETKFDSGTGWPSFWQPVARENIGIKTDNSLFMQSIEVHCPRCGAHLGHIFDDGPPPTNQRYCINSAALSFEPMENND